MCLNNDTFGYTFWYDNRSHSIKSMQAKYSLAFSVCSGNSKKTELYISGEKGDVSGELGIELAGEFGGELVSDIVDRLVRLFETDHR